MATLKLSKQKIRIRKVVFINLLIIFLIALFLRTYKLYCGYVLQGNDAPFFILFALGLTKSNNAVIFLAQLLNYRWGIIQPLVLLINVLFLNTFNLKLTEFSLTFGTALLGSLGVISVYLLTKKIKNRLSGLIAALLVSLFTLHVGMSRNTVGSDHVVADFILVLTVYFFYIYLKKGKYPFISSLFVSIYTLSTGTFLGIYPLLLFMVLLFSIKERKNSKVFDFKQFIKYIINPKLLLLPLLTILYLIINYLVLNLLGANNLGYVGHIFQRTSSPGFYLLNFVNYFILNTGLIFSIFLFCGFVYGVFKLIKLEKESILTVWALIYLLPFVFLISPEVTVVRGYLGAGTLPLIMLGSIMLIDLLKHLNKKINKKVSFIIIAIIITVCTSALFNCINIVFQVPENEERFYGSVVPNMGTKTAGYYLRMNSKEDSIIFTDLGVESVKYYTKRKIIGLKNEPAKKLLEFYKNNKNKIDYIIISSENEDLFKNDLNNYYKVAEIYDLKTGFKSKSHLISIYSKSMKEYDVLDVNLVDVKFDKQYGNLKSLSQDIFSSLLKEQKYKSLLNKLSKIRIIGAFFK